MGQEQNGTKPAKRKHLTWEDRVRLETLIKKDGRKKKPNFTRLSKDLGFHRTTLRREYMRGRTTNVDSELREFPVYSAHKAHGAAKAANQNKGPRPKLTTGIAAELRTLIAEQKLSPYAAVTLLKKRGDLPRVPSERTVYNAIDAGLLGITRQQLPYKPPKKRPKRNGTRMAYTNARGRSITQRPAAAEDRIEYGHWEMDTVVGCVGGSTFCLLVLTERHSRRQIIRRIRDRTQRSIRRALNAIERSADNIFLTMKSLTCDNGCEFLDADAIERSCLRRGSRCLVYHAHPYSSFERGSNENANRLIRRFIPKGSDIGSFSLKQIQDIEDWMNALPRKLHDGLSAAEKVALYFKEHTV